MPSSVVLVNFLPVAPLCVAELIWLADNDADQSSEGEYEAPGKLSNSRKRYSAVSSVTVFHADGEADGENGAG